MLKHFIFVFVIVALFSSCEKDPAIKPIENNSSASTSGTMTATVTYNMGCSDIPSAWKGLPLNARLDKTDSYRKVLSMNVYGSYGTTIGLYFTDSLNITSNSITDTTYQMFSVPSSINYKFLAWGTCTNVCFPTNLFPIGGFGIITSCDTVKKEVSGIFGFTHRECNGSNICKTLRVIDGKFEGVKYSIIE